MKQILHDFWNFIKDPRDERYLGNDKKYKWNVLFTLFICELLLLIVHLPFHYLLEKFVIIEGFYDESFTLLKSFLLIVIAVPFIEELLFRYFLKRTGIMKYLFSQKTWHRIFPVLFYTSVFTFGFVHITNYELTSIWIIIAAPILVFTQIIGGFVMAYLRVMFNFWMGFLYNALWNFTALFIMDGSYYLLDIDKVDIKNDNYELVVEPQQFISLNESLKTEYTAGIDTIYVLKAKNQTINEILEIVSQGDAQYKGSPSLINFDFKSEKGIHKDSLLSILEKEGFIEKQTPTN